MSDPTLHLPVRRGSAVDPLLYAFLARYDVPNTRISYRRTLEHWIGWCREHSIDPLDVQRAHIEVWARWLEEHVGNQKSTVATKLHALASFYRYAHEEEIIERNPMRNVRRPHVSDDTTTEWLDRFEMSRLIEAARTDRNPHAFGLVALCGLNGLRISEALGIDLADVVRERDYPCVRLLRKGGDRQILSVCFTTAAALNTMIGDRTVGPLFVTATGGRLSRSHAHRIIKRLVARAGLTKRVSAHTLRHSYVTIALDLGANPQDVQTSTGHKDGRMLRRYNHRKDSIERNPTFIVSAAINAVA